MRALFVATDKGFQPPQYTRELIIQNQIHLFLNSARRASQGKATHGTQSAHSMSPIECIYWRKQACINMAVFAKADPAKGYFLRGTTHPRVTYRLVITGMRATSRAIFRCADKPRQRPPGATRHRLMLHTVKREPGTDASMLSIIGPVQLQARKYWEMKSNQDALPPRMPLCPPNKALFRGGGYIYGPPGAFEQERGGKYEGEGSMGMLTSIPTSRDTSLSEGHCHCTLRSLESAEAVPPCQACWEPTLALIFPSRHRASLPLRSPTSEDLFEIVRLGTQPFGLAGSLEESALTGASKQNLTSLTRILIAQDPLCGSHSSHLVNSHCPLALPHSTYHPSFITPTSPTTSLVQYFPHSLPQLAAGSAVDAPRPSFLSICNTFSGAEFAKFPTQATSRQHSWLLKQQRPVTLLPTPRPPPALLIRAMMPTIESRPQPFNGQRRQQRHPEDESINGFHPVTSSGNFLLPDAQGGFTFSAEPAMMDYSSLNALPTSHTNPQESAFTPNTGSSFDSSLHPDLINPSYPPPNAYMQQQSNYSLSPGMNSRNGHSLSPSQSIDHISPETGYLSESNYQDLSTYTTPSYGDQYLEDQFSNINVADPFTTHDAFDNFPSGMQMSLPISDDVLATYNAQTQLPLPTTAHSEAHSQLMSPCPTNNSSPIIADDSSRHMNTSGAQYSANQFHPSSTPPNPPSHTLRSTPSKQQHSPALTNSPGNMTLANPQPRATHLTSPIVRVENYSTRGSPSPSDTSRPMSKRSHGSRRSGNHLSVPADESSDDDDAKVEQVRAQLIVRSAERGEDGAWLPGGPSGQVGLNPEDRDAMKDVWVPSIDDIAEQRFKNEKKLEVVDWLSKSEVGSDAGDGGSSIGLLKPFSTRRRAKSTNDAHRQGFGANSGLGVRTDFTYIDDSGIPGPGLYIDERSEFDDYEDEDEDDEPQSPPAAIDFNNTDVESYFPPAPENGAPSTAVVRPWNDAPTEALTSERYQPPTSNAAMMRFRQRAKDVESASLAATLGSRRMSESDLGSVRDAPGVVKAIEPGRDLKKAKERQRRPSFLESIIPKRAPSGLLKRKGSIPAQPPETPEKAKDPVPEKPKRMGSWGRPKSPRLDTSVASHGRDVGPPSSTNLSATSGPWATAKNAIRRSRSRSDLGKSPGLAELMTQHGGPPMPMLASPLAETEATKHSPLPSPGGDDDDEETQETITMDLKVRCDPIIPTFEGFKTHARQLNPRLVDYMVERITQEQLRRYKRLLEFKVKHLNAVKNRNCSSAKFCTALGGESKQLPPRAGNKDSEAPFIGFQITAPGSSDDDGEPPPEGTVVSAQFPSGVPLPPVKRLPAEFECPLCFKVKKFYKPSDWTKHVHEDVQPFTCTFPNCGEPKSFKRKADWVRHENERHRQLENWTCCIGDCSHTCYRKDNFVQHLVREHKIAEPRARTGRGANKDTSANTESASWQQGFSGMPTKDSPDDIWKLVENCRRDTTKLPKDEPCRFCGNICNSWKKLTVHLAKHMEQISMPILPLVEQKQMNADTVISPVVEMSESRKLSVTPSRSPIDNPSRYMPNNNSTLAPGIDPSFGQFPPDNSSSTVAPNVMHTYPPPQLVAYRNQPGPQKGNYTNFVPEDSQSYAVRSYPGLQEPPKARGAYVNGLQIPSQPYHNGNIQNGPNRYPMTPISAIGQQQQAVFTTSPVDTTPYSTDTVGSTTYFTHEPQAMTAGGVSDMGYDSGNSMQYQPSAYQEMSYMNTQQHNYQYQGQ
ncbi:uncharacterized protein BDR25DRAFT_397354 [Lindgomyces ingoldianus]|uniref:Uncharacterized protein n=1 Tax=Lindgomyces ingoldianus TaxID=673940 RepID=A0ACB6Q8T6_9PLEO|nr:uncharacterized protein BDR25DRAFT_397354 [Lindgomyces ingoldianus]KAF2462998.1 hypothetical protein BDR25DRAFT_397354 [Lindgomyces ingoldianus]